VLARRVRRRRLNRQSDEERHDLLVIRSVVTAGSSVPIEANDVATTDPDARTALPIPSSSGFY